MASIKPAMAQYLGVLFCLKKAPPNIITIPQTAVSIIAFMFPYTAKRGTVLCM
jgi:hypothetical protein